MRRHSKSFAISLGCMILIPLITMSCRDAGTPKVRVALDSRVTAVHISIGNQVATAEPFQFKKSSLTSVTGEFTLLDEVPPRVI